MGPWLAKKGIEPGKELCHLLEEREIYGNREQDGVRKRDGKREENKRDEQGEK